MFCKNCGAVIEDGQTVCGNCGKEIPAAPKKEEEKEEKKEEKKQKIPYWYKSKDGKLVTGVFAGMGKKYNKNPWLFRIIWIVLMCIPVIGWGALGFWIVASIVWKYDDELNINQ